MDFVSIIVLIGIVQGIFIGILLFTRSSGNKKANRLLGILFFNISVSLLYYFFYTSNLFDLYPHFQKTTFPTTFLYGPLIYFYAKAQTDSSFKFNWKQLLHFIPFLIIVISNIPFYLQSAEYKLAFLYEEGIIKDKLQAIQSASQVIQLTAYIIFTKFIIKNHIRELKNKVSLTDEISLRWLNISFNYFFSVFALVTMHLILIYFGVDLTSIYHVTIPVIVTIFIFVLGYHGLKQPEIIIDNDKNNSDKKYERSTLTAEMSEVYLKRLLDMMQNEKPYLASSISLVKLASMIGISTHHLSQIINNNLGHNFYDFINTYRVEEAKRLLCEPNKKSMTIYAVGLESGFNSKSAFNTCFKKITNQTPSEFKKSQSL